MTDTPSGNAPPPPPPPPSSGPPRRLTRRRDGRMIFGVAAGLGDYFQLDPIIVRIAFVVLAITGGAGVVLYLLAALLMPGDRGEEAPVHDLVRRIEDRRGRRWLGIAIIVVAVAVLLGNLHSVDVSIVWGLALIALGVLLFQQEGVPWDRTAAATTSGGTPPPPPAPAEAASAPPAWTTPSWGSAQSWQQPIPDRPRHYHHHHGPPIGWITVALSLVAAGVALLLSQAGAIPLTAGSGLAIVLGVLGAGLVVGAFVRRSWLLIVLGVLMVPFVITAGLVNEPLSGGIGERQEVPLSAQQVHSSYDLGVGHLTLDLTQAHLGAAPATVHVSVAFGRLDVLVPPDLPVTVHAHASAGRLFVLDRLAQGVRIGEDVESPGTTSTENGLTLDLDMGFGNVQVERAAATTGAQ